jgi:hypothetical protein
MAGITFDDLVDSKQSKAITFDDLPSKDLAQYPPGSALESFGLGISAGQMPFADRLTSAMAAGAVAPFVPETYSELYKTAQDYSRSTREASPNAALAGNIAGIASSIPAAFSNVPKVTGALSGAGRILKGVTDVAGKVATYSPFKGSGFAAGAGNLATKMAGSAAVAAPVTGAYFAGEAKPGEMGQEFGKGATMGAAVGAALPVAGAVLGSAAAGSKNIYRGITARGQDAIQDTLEVMKKGSNNLYTYADNVGVMAKPEAAQELVSGLSGVIKSKDIASQRLYSGTLAAIKDLSDDVTSGNTGLMTLDRHRQILGNIAKDITNPNNKQEAAAASKAIDVIDEFIEGLGPQKLASGTPEAVDALKQARAAWAKSKKFEKVGDIIIKSRNDANKLKRDLNSFRDNPKNTLGWSAAERKALDFAADQTVGEGLIKMAGKFGFDLGSGRSIGNTALPVLGGVGAGAASGAVLPAGIVIGAGTAARAAQKGLALGKAESLLKIIENGGTISTKAIDALTKAEKRDLISRAMKLPAEQARKILTRTDVLKEK